MLYRQNVVSLQTRLHRERLIHVDPAAVFQPLLPDHGVHRPHHLFKPVLHNRLAKAALDDVLVAPVLRPGLGGHDLETVDVDRLVAEHAGGLAKDRSRLGGDGGSDGRVGGDVDGIRGGELGAGDEVGLGGGVFCERVRR